MPNVPTALDLAPDILDELESLAQECGSDLAGQASAECDALRQLCQSTGYSLAGRLGEICTRLEAQVADQEKQTVPPEGRYYAWCPAGGTTWQIIDTQEPGHPQIPQGSVGPFADWNSAARQVMVVCPDVHGILQSVATAPSPSPPPPPPGPCVFPVPFTLYGVHDGVFRYILECPGPKFYVVDTDRPAEQGGLAGWQSPQAADLTPAAPKQ